MNLPPHSTGGRIGPYSGATEGFGLPFILVGAAPLANARPACRGPLRDGPGTLSPLAVPSVSSVERPGRSHSLPTGAN